MPPAGLEGALGKVGQTVADVIAGRAVHAPLADPEPQGVGGDGQFHGEFGAIHERRHHVGLLVVGLSECLLRFRGPVHVIEPLEVAGTDHLQAHGPDVSGQVGGHSGSSPSEFE